MFAISVTPPATAAMSFPVNLQTLPSGVFEDVFTPENVRGRTSVNSLTPLSFPKSRSALWDGSPAGEKLRLHLCSHRNPRLVLLEKALRLAQRHVRHNNKPQLYGFFLGSVSVDSDEEGITVTLDRFDPGREQARSSGRAPSAPLPGDVVVPCLFSIQTETSDNAVVQTESELHHSFKVLQQFVSSRKTLDLSQLVKLRGRVICSQQADATAFGLNWSAVCPFVGVDVQPVRAVPIIPTALLRSLSGISRPLQHGAGCQRGFLTMDQTRKLLLMLESDPKASTLPLVGLWLSGVTHFYNPQVWAWCLRFLFSSTLQDRVLSESGCFLLVLFGSTHRAPQFFQCRGPRPGPGTQLDYQLLTAFQSTTLYSVASSDGQTLQCELGSDDHRQIEVFSKAFSCFSSAPPAGALSVSDQDSGVEDEDVSPRPSPSPHAPAQQTRRVQPSVPELSLLIDSSFTSTHRPPPPAADRRSVPPTFSSPAPTAADWRSVPPTSSSAPPTSSSSALPPSADRRSAPPTSSPAPPTAADRISAPPTSSFSAPPPTAADRRSAPPPPHHFHSTPNSNLQQPCSCCSTQAYDYTSIFSPCNHAPSSQHHTPPPSVPPFSTHLVAAPSSTPCTPASPHHLAATSFTPVTHTFPHHPAPPSTTSTPTLPHHTAPPSTTSTPALPHHPAPPSTTSTPALPHHTGPPSTTSSPALPHHPAPPFSHHLSSPLSPSTLPPPALPSSSLLPPPWPPRPSCVNQCCNQLGGITPSDTYQLLLQQDQQLRLLQTQVQMLLEAQGKLQSSSQQVDTQMPRSTASIAVGTGASLFWGGSDQLLPHQEALPAPSSPTHFSVSHDLSVVQPVEEVKDGDVADQVAPCSPVSSLQSPVLGESVSMYRPADEQQSFYLNLMTQLTSRLQESDSKHEAEKEDESRRKSLSAVSDYSPSSQSFHSSSSRKTQQSPAGDAVVTATLRQLQQLGVDVDEDVLTECDRNLARTVESISTLASINPAAAVSRLSVSEPTLSSLFPEGSVDLSLEANAIALRYLSDSQLTRLSLGAAVPRVAPPSANISLLSPSNMSLATRKYMRRYGLIEEEEDGKDEEEREVSGRQLLTKALNVKLPPQSQLIRELRPKMQLLAEDNKENLSSERPILVRASSRQAEGSVGNILDLSRLRQLPKLF